MGVIYASVEQLKRRLNIHDNESDQTLSEVLESASRAIDRATGAFFYLESRTVELLTSSHAVVFSPWPLWSLTTLESSQDRVSWETWASSHYYLVPEYAPHFAIRAWGRRFPTRPGIVRVTAQFGYATIPTEITEATLILASRFFKRTEAPLGVAGASQFGVFRLLSDVDPDVAALIAPYRMLDAL